MKILKIKVSGQSVVWENPFTIVSGSCGYLGCEFSFSDEWEGLDKAIRFYHPAEKKYYGFENVDGVVIIPHKVLKGRVFYIAVGGYGEDGETFVPTSAVKIKLEANGYGEADEDVEEGEGYKSALAELLNLAGECRDACIEMRYAPYIHENGNWFLYNRDAGGYEDSGICARGLSAYEIAKSYGFEGTEEEWLESLKAEAVQVDSQMSDESIYPVQNKVAKKYVDDVAKKIPTKMSDLDNDSGYVDVKGISIIGATATTAQQTADKAHQTADEAKSQAENAESIAKGKATGYVFSTYASLITFLSIESNKAKLTLGDNLYIRALDVPDYWWDGSSIQPLETQKVDLTEYPTKAELAAAMGDIEAAFDELHNYAQSLIDGGGN